MPSLPWQILSATLMDTTRLSSYNNRVSVRPSKPVSPWRVSMPGVVPRLSMDSRSVISTSRPARSSIFSRNGRTTSIGRPALHSSASRLESGGGWSAASTRNLGDELGRYALDLHAALLAVRTFGPITDRRLGATTIQSGQVVQLLGQIVGRVVGPVVVATPLGGTYPDPDQLLFHAAPFKRSSSTGNRPRA